MSLSAYRNIWKRLAQTSLPWRKVAPPSKESTPPPAAIETPTAFPPLDLTVPADFTAFIHDFDFPSSTFQQVLSKIDQAIREQKSIHETKYQELCRKFLQLNLPSTSARHQSYCEGIKKTYENSFQRHLLELRESVLKVYQQVGPEKSPKKAVFNAEYTPVLEQYFEYNAFPSARDRELLARKSSMTPRQIEVWFQNHRRRARKEGRHLKRITTDPLPAALSLDALKKQMPAFMIRKEERYSPPLDAEEMPSKPMRRPLSPPATPPAAALFAEFSLDDIPSRPSAWPAKYSPRDGATFFTSQRPTFGPPVWDRKVSSPSSIRTPSPPSINELCSEFISKMHLGGTGSIRKQHDHKSPGRSIANRRRFALESLPTVMPSSAVKSTTRTYAVPSDDAPITFGSTSSLRSRKRHQPYNLSLRKYPIWSLDKPKPCSTPPRPSIRRKAPIPRRPSLSCLSSSGSSLCSDPPTPRDSPNPFIIQSLPFDSPDSLCDPYAFDFSADIVTSSYPSSTERFTSHIKSSRSHSHLSSHPSSPSYSRLAAY